jgi:hypothetical protein
VIIEYRNVVEGGLGYSWPYIGGWELNARGLALGMPMPDTLAVSFQEQVKKLLFNISI